MPASSAVWIIRTDSSWSVLPMAPSIIVPSAYSLTDMPVPPRILRSMGPAKHGNRASCPVGQARCYQGFSSTPHVPCGGLSLMA